jgi:AbrB family looped-hinge helix DNA binding protein
LLINYHREKNELLILNFYAVKIQPLFNLRISKVKLKAFMRILFYMYRLKVHKKGIIVIPKEIREKFNLKEGDEVNVIVDDEGIYIFPRDDIRKYFGSDKDTIKALNILEEERRRERESST